MLNSQIEKSLVELDHFPRDRCENTFETATYCTDSPLPLALEILFLWNPET